MDTGLSIVIPTKNRINFLARAIESVKKQNHPKYEILVIDDDPSKSSKRTCETEAQKDTPISYICNFRAPGASGARNSGILNAKYDLIAFLDDDDYWLEGKLESQFKIIKNLTANNFVIHSNFLSLNTNNTLVKNFSQDYYTSKFNAFVKKNGRLPKLSTVLINKILLEDCGLFDEKLRAREDFDIYLRLIEGYPFYLDTNFLTISDKSHKERTSNNYKSLIDATLILTEKYFFLTFNDNKKLSTYIDSNLKTLLSMNQWSHSRQVLKSHIRISILKRELRLIKIFLTAKYNKLYKQISKFLVNCKLT